MTEIKLLKVLNTKLREKKFMQIEIDISENSKEKEMYRNEINNLNDEITKIELNLKSIGDKELSKKTKINFINQISAYIEEMNDAPENIRLSRNQGLIIENYLFGMIIEDLRRFVSTDIFNGTIRHNLNYTYSEEDSVNKTDFINFLNQEIEILKRIENPNLVELRKYLNEIEERIFDKYCK